MVSSPPPIANPAPPGALDGRRIAIRGEAAAAILYAVNRLPANVDIDSTVVTVRLNPDGSPTVAFWTIPNDGRWRVAFELTPPAGIVHLAVVPKNAVLTAMSAKLDPTLLGTDVHAMAAAFRTPHKAVDLSDEVVFIEQDVYGGRLEYGIGYFSPFFVCCVIRCDDQTRVDAKTMIAEHWRCVG